MINTWWICIISYLVLYVIYTQHYKLAAKKSINTSALTVLLRFLSGVIVLLAIPLFDFKVPTNPITYLFLAIACIFYALSDRMYTASYKKLEVSSYSVLAQLATLFIFIFGLILFKEPIIMNRIIGALLILLANIMVLYKKKKFLWNKYYLYNIIGNIAYAAGTTFDIGISDQFNLPFYVAIVLIVPSMLVFIFEQIKIKDVVKEYKKGNKKAIIIVSILEGAIGVLLLRAFQLEKVTVVAPIASLRTILNVLAAHIFLKEKGSLKKKIVAAIITVIGVILINL